MPGQIHEHGAGGFEPPRPRPPPASAFVRRLGGSAAQSVGPTLNTGAAKATRGRWEPRPLATDARSDVAATGGKAARHELEKLGARARGSERFPPRPAPVTPTPPAGAASRSWFSVRSPDSKTFVAQTSVVGYPAPLMAAIAFGYLTAAAT